MCAITAGGRFDHTKGGHLYLVDLKLVIEFPAGSTILLPSAVLRHGNTAIDPEENRLSFTQYAAGGLFRWVEYGFQTWNNLKASNGKLAHKVLENRAKNWGYFLNLFSKVDELQKDHILVRS